ncbi:hypothetical protein [Undibacterium sp. TJN19]|uniref:hypothetical protein n=1 Tax=Undibacterium sp. TJN19 TaxID=3413055 RepID=UPI003BF390A9
MSTTLELKIKSLVEGLQGVTDLAKEITSLGSSAKAAGANASEGKKGFTELGSEAEAYKTIGVRSFAEIRAEISKVNLAYQELTNSNKLSGKELQAVTDATKTKLAGLNAELAGSVNKSKEAGDGFGGINTPLGQLKDSVASLITAFTALAIAYGIKESADYAARTEVLGTTLGVVGKNAGYSASQLSGYEKEVKGLGITTQATRQSLTQMIQVGLEIGPTAAEQVSQVSKLARAAQDLAVVTGENSSATLSRLITNIQQMDTEGLRYMGLTVNIQQAQDKFALSLGKTSEQLTQQQKIQAVANAALSQAANLTGAYEASMQNVGKQIQSIKRYQEELANAIGEKLLPAYFELVKAATDFLKVAEQTFKSSDISGQGARNLAAGTKEFFTGLSDFFSGILKIGAEVTPVMETVLGTFLDFGGAILRNVAAVLQLGDTVDATGTRISSFGQALNDTIIIPLGILIAGLRDGFDFIGAVISGLTGGVLDFAGIFLQALGKIVGYFKSDLGKAIAGAGDDLRETAKSLTGYADETVNKFARGETQLSKFNAKLSESKEAAVALAKSSSFGDIEEQIRKLVEAKRKSALTDTELKKSSEDVAAAIKRLGIEVDDATGKTKLSEDQIKKLNAELLNVTKESAQQFSEAINDMGLKIAKFGETEYLTPLSKEFDKIAGDILKLADNATTTSLQFREAFAKGLDSAKTLADLDKLSDSLINARNAGKDLGDAANQINGKFQEVFTTSLKVARTKDDFALLTAELKQMGDKGELSAKIVDKAIADLQERIKGTRAETALLAQQATDSARSLVAVGQAHLAVARADYDVGHARIDVWKAQNKYAKDGSDLSQEELRLAQLNLQLAEARAAEARLHYVEAQQSNKVLIAQEELILATKRLERDVDNEALILAKDSATKNLEGAQASYEVTKQKAIKQQEVVLKIEEEVLQQKLAVEQASAIAEQMKAAAEQSGNISSNTSSASENIRSAASQSQNLTSGLISAAGAAASLTTNLKGANAEQLKLASAIQGIAAAQRRLDIAQGHGTGVSQIGGGGKAGGGVDGVRNVEQETTSSRNSRITAENQKTQSAANDLNHTGVATDSDIADMLFDSEHGKRIEPTEENKARAQTAWFAARANKEIFDANRSAFSSDGADSIVKNFNRAKSLMESLGLNASYGDSAGINDGSGGQGGFGSGKYGFGMKKIDGSHRGGLDRVPKDYYLALLHEDEKVLTAPEADSYRKAPTVSDLSRQLLERISYESKDNTPSLSEQAVKASATQKPSKTIQVNFTDGSGKTVPMTTDSRNEPSLLELLNRAKGVAS